ncbi:LOW QUALITY PROTEIN: transcriptional repressor SIRR, partial [Mycobacterium tuberculosis T85]
RGCAGLSEGSSGPPRSGRRTRSAPRCWPRGSGCRPARPRSPFASSPSRAWSTHEKYGAVTLTDSGRRAALAMVRRHRLLETFLVNELGYRWDEVHDEAEVLEHAVSDRLMARIDAKLGFPQRDPHGDPIPGADGQVPTPPARQLWACRDGDTGTVARISDADPQMLRYFASIGISLDSRLRVLARREFAGMISVAIDSADGATVDLGSPAAQAIWVVS